MATTGRFFKVRGKPSRIQIWIGPEDVSNIAAIDDNNASVMSSQKYRTLRY
jgi:hypothetical protein